MAIYKKNQATLSQKHTKDFSRLSNEDDDMLSREHTICKQHQNQESWLNIIGLNRPLTCHLVKIFVSILTREKNRIKYSISNIHLITFQIDIRYSYSTQLSNHSQMDIRYSLIKRPSNDIPDGYSQMDIRYSNIKRPS